MSLFGSFLTHEPSLGIDIGTTSIKVAEFSHGKDGLRLVNYGILETLGYLERANSALQTSTLKLSEEEVSSYLRVLLQKTGVSQKDAVIGVPSFAAFSTLIEIPAGSQKEIENIMQFQAKQYVPLPLEEVTLDWQKVGERSEGNSTKVQVLLIAIVNEQIARFRRIAAACGLRLKGVEIEGMSLARVLAPETEAPTLVLDIGGRSSGLYVVQKGLLKFATQTDFSGGSLTQTLANGLTISMLRAEQVKKQRGLMRGGGDEELSTLMEVILDVILKEAMRVKEVYEATYHETISGVLLSGGGANLLGIQEYMTKGMGMPVTKVDPLAHLAHSEELTPLQKDLGPLLAVAIGLGTK